MFELKQWPSSHRRGIRGVFTDIDDTLTTEGAITADALNALTVLKASGLHVIPITGRPVGWSEPFAQSWPVDALVTENGSVALIGKQKLYQQDALTRERNFSKMQDVIQHILRMLPHAKLAIDSPGRETDVAIDHSEFTHLSQEDIAKVVTMMQQHGMNATVSSIHINGWFGSHNKFEGARWIVQSLFQRDLITELDQWVYVGDSTNDQLMFKHFQHSIGVANLRRFEAQLTHLPKYITRSDRGAGFAEVAQALLEVR